MLKLAPEAWEQVSRHALAAYPAECCGLLLGDERDGGARWIREALPAPNVHESGPARRYRIGPEQFLEAERRAARQGLTVLGVYHSHPDVAARPSRFDLEGSWPWYSYLIVAVARGSLAEAASWRLDDERNGFQREPLEWLDEKGQHVRPSLDPHAASGLRGPTGEPDGPGA